MPQEPEQIARTLIDQKLHDAGWVIQDRDAMNLYAGVGVAVREFPVTKPNNNPGFADYMLFVDRKAVGVLEAKKRGETLSGVADQSAGYAAGLNSRIPRVEGGKLPFLYQSTGIETTFRDERDPDPRSRWIFSFHRPETLREWLRSEDTLRKRLQHLPPLNNGKLWDAQVKAITNLEASFTQNKPRALIQMATGSGKTFTAVNFVYRLIKYARARRVLFLVDRNNLGRQAYAEFDAFQTPDDGRKLTDLYNIQHLKSNVLDDVSKVHITTIQRLYSMLKGDEDFDTANEEVSHFEMARTLDDQQPRTVVYNPHIPIEYYDFIIIDECHRSIYNLWRDVLLYFDAFLIGLTATPSALTFGFFNRNLVMEYSRERAVADGVNVDGQVYRIRTRITEQGSKVEAGYGVYKRDKLTRAQRWELLDEDFTYDGHQLDQSVVAEDQIRTIIRTFKEKLFTEIFPNRTEVPKTLVFAKDDTHAENIVNIIREVFGRGDDFCKKITYKVSGSTPEQLIRDFRTSYNPRIAVSVDMIATGTDIKPLEVLLFMRDVKSRLLFDQMQGRGTRVVSPTEYQTVVPDNDRKTHFVIVDAVGVMDNEKVDPQILERKKSKTFLQLLEALTLGAADEDDLSSLAGRLSRLGRKATEEDLQQIEDAANGQTLGDLINNLLDGIDPDRIVQTASDAQISEEAAAERLLEEACRPLASNPALRNVLETIHNRNEQTVDVTSIDETIETGFTDQQASQMVKSFQKFIEENRDRITALALIFQRPTSQQHLTFELVQELAEALHEQPPNTLTTEALWKAYAQLEQDKVRGVNEPRVLTDLVSLVRHAVELDDELQPYPDVVRQRYEAWLAAHEASGETFTPEQRWWLDRIAEHIGVNLSISLEDLNGGIFFGRGGQVKASNLFEENLNEMIDELNMTLR